MAYRGRPMIKSPDVNIVRNSAQRAAVKACLDLCENGRPPQSQVWSYRPLLSGVF